MYWAPKLVGLFGVFFLSLFAFDVFEMDAGFWDKIGAFLIHLLPSALLLLAVLVGWRWPATGSALFLGLGVLYIVLAWDAPWTWSALISGPLFLIGILFLVGRRMPNQSTVR